MKQKFKIENNMFFEAVKIVTALKTVGFEVNDLAEVLPHNKTKNDVFLEIVNIIGDLIDKKGMNSLDIEDLKQYFSHFGNAILCNGKSSKQQKGEDAYTTAMYGAIGDNNLHTAKALIVNIKSTKDIKLQNITSAMNTLRKQCNLDVNILYGHTIDENIGDTVSVSIIATGIEND